MIGLLRMAMVGWTQIQVVGLLASRWATSLNVAGQVAPEVDGQVPRSSPRLAEPPAFAISTK